MVPVLSSRLTSTSPDASTARPLMASTFKRATRCMPAIPVPDRGRPRGSPARGQPVEGRDWVNRRDPACGRGPREGGREEARQGGPEGRGAQGLPGVLPEAPNGPRGQEDPVGQPRQQDGQGDLVG